MATASWSDCAVTLEVLRQDKNCYRLPSTRLVGLKISYLNLDFL